MLINSTYKKSSESNLPSKSADPCNKDILTLTKEAKKIGLDLGTLATKIKEYGWSIPVYSLPVPFQNEVVLRMVLKVGFNYGMAEKLYEDIVKSIQYCLNSKSSSSPTSINGSGGIC